MGKNEAKGRKGKMEQGIRKQESGTAGTQNGRSMEIRLKPCWANGRIECMEVAYLVEGLRRDAGEELCAMQLSTVSVPGCDPEKFHAWDEAGELPLEVSCSSPYPYEWKHWSVTRETVGPIHIGYTVRPRELPPDAVCGPYFDFRSEDGGANGAGISFLAKLVGATGRLRLHWDLGAMPEGSDGVCTFGEGDVELDGELEQLRQCYYAVGRIGRITQGEFGFYWLSDPHFDVGAIARYTGDLFRRMQAFFCDTDPVYRIFVRKDPFPTSGGTALLRSYMFGWNDSQPVSVREKRFILAHEMVHNWPALYDEPYGTTTWYSEGMAEYYSLLLPLRMGLLTPEEAGEELQKRTDAYYTNPTRHLGEMEAVKICWQDRRAQRLPYGRGMLFLANADVQIRQASGSAANLDDVMLRLLEKTRRGEQPGNQEFLETVKELSGADLTKALKDMREGVPFAPLDGCFDGYFSAEEKEMEEADTGRLVRSYEWRVCR